MSERHVTTDHAPFTAPVRYHVQETSTSPTNGERSLIVALHGMGMSGGSFLRVLRHLPTTGVVVAPDGPYPFEKRTTQEITIGYGWYIYRGDQDEFREHLERSEAFLLDLVDRVADKYNVDRGRTTLIGFSQGGYLAGFAALRHPERFPGLVIASSRLKHEFLTEGLRSRQLPKTLFLHSAGDHALPIARAQESMKWLRDHGGDVELHEHDAGHRLPPEALRHMADWLTRQGLA